ncbi:hypothetical protein ACT3S8_18335, partial [Halomonas sp. AOP42-D2-25]
PSEIGEAEVSAIGLMAFRGGWLQLDDDFDIYMMKKYQISAQDLKEKLISTKLFMLDGDYIRPIHNQLHMITRDEGNGYVGNEIERFDIWCKKNEIEPSYTHLILVE